MAGYYVPSSFAGNYVNNKKNADGTYVYDSARNQAGISAQRNLQQLNKQYNVTINNAYAQHLMANQGLRSSMLGSGYKDAYVQNLQSAVDQEVNQISLSVQDTKQSIFESLGKDLGQIAGAQQKEMQYMGRMASNLEQYFGYLQTLTGANGANRYTDDYQFKPGTFEDNYDKLFDQQINNTGILGKYTDESNNPALAYEDWLRQNNTDTDWLDWAYGSGLNQYKDFAKNGVMPNSVFGWTQKPGPNNTPTPTVTPAKKKSIWDYLGEVYMPGSAS